MRDYAIAIIREIVRHFNSPLSLLEQPLVENAPLREDVFDEIIVHYGRNIAPEMAAEFIAHKFGLTRITEVN